MAWQPEYSKDGSQSAGRRMELQLFSDLGMAPTFLDTCLPLFLIPSFTAYMAQTYTELVLRISSKSRNYADNSVQGMPATESIRADKYVCILNPCTYI
jgi:hypothetical protein